MGMALDFCQTHRESGAFTDVQVTPAMYANARNYAVDAEKPNSNDITVA